MSMPKLPAPRAGSSTALRAQVADMHHQRQLVLSRNVFTGLDQGLRLLLDNRPDHPQLEAFDEARVGLDRARDRLGVDVLHPRDVGPTRHRVRVAAYVYERN